MPILDKGITCLFHIIFLLLKSVNTVWLNFVWTSSLSMLPRLLFWLFRNVLTSDSRLISHLEVSLRNVTGRDLNFFHKITVHLDSWADVADASEDLRRLLKK